MPDRQVSEPRTGTVRYLLGTAFYSMSYVEWGDPAAPVVVCVHALTRNGRDFDALAQALAPHHRVICPDLPGRGASDWLSDPSSYQPPAYCVALSHLLAVIGGPVAWLGTSLGGVLGLLIAAAKDQPITRLVLNDVGPFIPAASLRRIRDYLAPPADRPPPPSEFADMAALEDHLREIHAPFGELTDDQWAQMARHSARPLPDGNLATHYDPAIAAILGATEPQDVDLWSLWPAITIPVLVLRGESSDVLLPDTLTRMLERPGTTTHTVPNTGHAPALMDQPTIDVIVRYLS